MTDPPQPARKDSASDDAPGSTTAPAPETGLATGSDAGEPGERRPVPPGDEQAAAAADDAPLPLTSTQVDPGREQDDGLTPDFREP